MTHDAPSVTHVIGIARSLLQAFPPVTIANDDVPYHERLNGTSHWYRPRDSHPLPVLDPDVGRDEAWCRLRFEVVRHPGTARAATAPDP